ncbi:MAG TPA: ATP-binding protein, partial [Casimicrobiaceae bacterium]|nr:ATP-binding protein [Casimicrobiaceae bacterium]
SPPAPPPDLEALLADVVASVRERECEVQDDTGRRYSLRARPYLTLDNKVDGVVLVLVDIDALQRSERAAALARDYAEATIRTARDPLLVLSADFRVEEANDAFYSTFKVSPAQSVGRLIYELGNGQWNIPRLRALLEDTRRRHSFFDDVEITHDFETIGQRTMLLSARTLSDAAGTPVRIVLGIHDLTESRRFEQALGEAAERFHFMTEAMPQKIFTTRPSGEVDYLNPRWAEYAGRTVDQMRGWGWKDIVHPDDLAENLRLWQQSIDTGEPFHFEHRLRRSDGEYRWHISRASAFKDASGEVMMWVGSNTDIHEVKEADRRKDEFLAMLAHELRGPLAPLTNMLEIMRRADGSPEAVERARDTMQRQVGQMTRLIDDLLDVSRISQGKLALRRGPVELASVLQQAIEANRPALDTAGHELTLTLASQPIYLHADPMRLAQVFGNLVNNAGKFSEPGGRISVSVERDGDEAAISVKDAGIGVPPEKLSAIFGMFTQLDRSLERSRGGLGIGLTLVRQLVEMHGGSVQARSDGPGRGTEFIVRLPGLIEKPSRTADGAAIAAEAAAASGRRILVVDDNRDSADSFAALLALAGYQPHTAYDGLAAVAAAASFRPDIVLLDIGLPKLNGYDAARRIRAEPWGKKMTLVAVTGWGQQEDRRRSTAAGFDLHLVKPIDYDELTRLLSEVPPG